MKKLLLSLGFVAATLAASAQTPSANVTLYNGAGTVEALRGTPYTYAAADTTGNFFHVADSTLANRPEGDTTKTWFISGSTNSIKHAYFIGGLGVGAFNDAGDAINVATIYNGDFATSHITADVNNFGTGTPLQIQIKDGISTWAIAIPGTKVATGKIDFKLTDFGLVDENYAISSTALTVEDWSAINEWQFQINTAGANGIGSGMVSIDNVRLRDEAAIAGIVEDFIATNSNTEVTAFDMMGTAVATGKSTEVVAGLQSGKVYVLRAGNNAIKIVK